MTTEQIIDIGKFLGFTVITHQGQLTFDGHVSANTEGERMKLFGGHRLEFTGRFCKDVKYGFNTDWNLLMLLVRLISEQSRGNSEKSFFDFNPGFSSTVYLSLLNADKETLFDAAMKFIIWYNTKNTPPNVERAIAIGLSLKNIEETVQGVTDEMLRLYKSYVGLVDGLSPEESAFVHAEISRTRLVANIKKGSKLYYTDNANSQTWLVTGLVDGGFEATDDFETKTFLFSELQRGWSL